MTREALSHGRRREARRQELLATAKSLRCAWALGVSTLYKLRSLAPDARDHTLDIIENSRLYFPSPEQFNDPFDCAPPFKLAGDISDPKFFEELQRDEERMAREAGLTAEQIAELRAKEGVPIEQMAEAVRKNTLHALRRDTRLLCFATEHCHPLMWSHYASSHTGICLHFHCDSGNLIGLARKVIYQVERRPVLIPLYRQSEHEITERLVFEKARFWDYESEYRIVGHTTTDWGYQFDAQKRVSFPPEALCGITLGMRISDPDRQTLLSLAARHRPRIPVWQAFECPDRFWMEVRRVR